MGSAEIMKQIGEHDAQGKRLLEHVQEERGLDDLRPGAGLSGEELASALLDGAPGRLGRCSVCSERAPLPHRHGTCDLLCEELAEAEAGGRLHFTPPERGRPTSRPALRAITDRLISLAKRRSLGLPDLLALVAERWHRAALLLVLLPSLAHAAPALPWSASATPDATLQDWLGALGLGTVLFMLFGGGRWLWGRLQGALPEVPPLPPPARSPSDHLPTAAELVALCQTPGLTLQDVCAVVWPGLPWSEAVEPWWIFPTAGYPRSDRGRQRWAPDPEWPEPTQRLAPAMWLYDRLQEARREGWISYTPTAASATKSRP